MSGQIPLLPAAEGSRLVHGPMTSCLPVTTKGLFIDPRGGPDRRTRMALRVTTLSTHGGMGKPAMFDKQSLEALLEELRDEYELEPDWEEIQRSVHLGIARADAGEQLGNIDSRVVPLINKHNPG